MTDTISQKSDACTSTDDDRARFRSREPLPEPPLVKVSRAECRRIMADRALRRRRADRDARASQRRHRRDLAADAAIAGHVDPAGYRHMVGVLTTRTARAPRCQARARGRRSHRSATRPAASADPDGGEPPRRAADVVVTLERCAAPDPARRAALVDLLVELVAGGAR